MLNISTNKIKAKIDKSDFLAFRQLKAKKTDHLLRKVIQWGAFLIFLIVLLPWTQNIRTEGHLTTLTPDQRPQEIQSVIAGRIEEWKVKEGDLVKKGDTIAVISEIKDDYFDDKLLERTGNQLSLKKQSVNAYSGKLNAQNTQLRALMNRRALETNKMQIKLEQTVLKIQNDSIAYEAARLDNTVANDQYIRMQNLYKKGLKSLADLEKRKTKAQQTLAKEVSAKNKWLNSKNALLNVRVELNNILAKFESDYAKVTSEKFTTETNKFDSESSVNKLENQYSNYKVRAGMHVIKAPQDGYVTRLLIYGIGETIKEGTSLLSFMPKKYDLAVEIYVDPIDLPLMHVGEHVRLQFDGWPAIVFSGWPGASYGTYGGEVYAIDQFISNNGKYRILVEPDTSDHMWPQGIRVGGGSKALILLNNVPIFYELWRKINGFPPEFYKPMEKKNTDKK